MMMIMMMLMMCTLLSGGTKWYNFVPTRSSN